MRISEQIRARREQLGVTVRELAKRAKVSQQAVRHWEAGRSTPNKTTARLVESALSITLDWTEGRAVQGRPVGANALIGQGDVELLLTLVRLPPDVKSLFARLAAAYVSSHSPRQVGEETPTTEEHQHVQTTERATKRATRPSRKSSS